MRDSIKSIRAMVGWLIREPGCALLGNPPADLRFEINDDNVRELTRLSDKYIIEALQKDLRVKYYLLSILTIELHSEIYFAKG